jgi:hypothetical protein
MSMPETPIYKEGNPPGGKYKVGPAGQLLAIKTKTIPQSMGGLTHNQFRLRIDRPNAAHVSTAGRRVEMINHDYHTAIVRAVHSGQICSWFGMNGPSPLSDSVVPKPTSLGRVCLRFFT